MTTSPLSQIEQEAIFLAAVYGMIEGMVNREFFAEPSVERPTNLKFESESHKRLFSVLFGDFLALPQQRGEGKRPFGLPEPEAGPATNKTYLYLLDQIARSPQIGTDGTRLLGVVSTFVEWLNADAVCPAVWLPGLDIEFDMTMPRISIFQTVGDLSKHNFSRLEGRVKQLKKMLNIHGHDVDERLIYTDIPVFRAWLYDHLFSYHASTIGEFLNNIRWAIYAYLRPEFNRAFTPNSGGFRYAYDVPTTIKDELAYEMYWELMNAVRSGPSFPQFVVTDSLKVRF